MPWIHDSSIRNRVRSKEMKYNQKHVKWKKTDISRNLFYTDDKAIIVFFEVGFASFCRPVNSWNIERFWQRGYNFATAYVPLVLWSQTSKLKRLYIDFAFVNWLSKGKLELETFLMNVKLAWPFVVSTFNIFFL